MKQPNQNKHKLSDSMGVKVSILLIIILVGGNSIFIYNTLSDLDENKSRMTDIIEFREQMDMIFETVQKTDLGMRGFFINPNDGMLVPHIESFEDHKKSLESLESLFDKYNLEQDQLKQFMIEVKKYLELNSSLIEKIRIGDKEYVENVVRGDPGLELWKKYVAFSPTIEKFLDDLSATEEEEYQRDVFNTILFQVLILLIGIPALLVILKNITSASKKREELFRSIDENNRTFVYDNGVQIDAKEEENIIEYLKENLKEASHFISEITDGNYKVSWNGQEEEKGETNSENLAGHMLKMRNRMKEVKMKDDIQMWSANGLAKFSDIVRDNMHDLAHFADQMISELVKYIGANQAAFFVVNQQTELLELKGCFAYDRKKFVDISISKGQGLAGQCWLEKQIVHLKEIPGDYVKITSGLGEETPTSLVIVPILADDKVMGIIEIASFTELEDYKIEFIEKLSESIGSSLAMIQVNAQTSKLLRESKEMQEIFKGQEEMLRQNSEEMRATQEEMERKLSEAENKMKTVEEIFGPFEFDEEGKLIGAPVEQP